MDNPGRHIDRLGAQCSQLTNSKPGVHGGGPEPTIVIGDYALIDAEHTEPATIGYFEGVIAHMAPGGIMVFDDIPWSRELRRTWRRIANDERIDGAYALGRVGVAVAGPHR